MPEASAMTPIESPAETPKPAGISLPKLALGLLALVGLAVAARSLGARIPEFVAFVDGLGVWGPAVFMLAYALGVLLFVPGSALTLAAGALFGIGRGVVFAWCAATLGASLSFLVARYLARGAVEQRIAGSARFAAIDAAVGREGRKIVFLLRLSPAFPFNFLNFALGLTRVGFADYLIASVGMIPGTLLYVYYGSVLGLAAQLAGGAAPQRGAADILVLGLGLAATLAVTIFVTRLARRALAQATHG
jgi:uncharacterized membrane protein YdjX (TVP38/TMEM64 family)